MQLKRYILVFIACSYASLLVAQQPYFRSYDLPEELGVAPIRSLYQSDGDFIWLGTDVGLVLYDGLQYDLFLRPDSLGSNQVSSLYRDQSGLLWVGYQDGGIFHYNLFDQLQAWEPEEGWPAAPITAFAEDQSGNLWLSTYGEGLYYWNGKRLYNFGEDDGLSGGDVYTLSIDLQGRLWAGTDAGISVCWLEDGQKRIKYISRTEGLPDEIARVIEADQQGNAWIGTYDRGFGLISGQGDSVQFWIPQWDQGVISALELVRPDELWIGTEKSGVWRYDITNDLLVQLTDEEFKLSRINDLQLDQEGNIWILNNTNELLSANLLFEFIREDIRNVQALLVCQQNQLWIGTQNGLYRREQRAFAQDTFLLELSGNFLSLYQDSYDNIWAGTFGEGIYMLNPTSKKTRHLSEANGLTNGSVLSIDGLGDKVWLATLGGVSEVVFQTDPMLIKEPNLRNYGHADGLGTNFIYKVFVDSRQRVWFATDGEGLCYLDGNEFRHIMVADSISVKSVYTITEDTHGDIWFSTPRDGVFRYDGNKASKFQFARGLRESDILGMATDDKGRVLLIHPAGIDLLDTEQERLLYYDKEVGIGAIEPNLNAFFQDHEGNIWIGTEDGVIRYSGGLPVAQTAPETRLRGVSVDLQALDFFQEHEFSHDRNNIIFDYSGLWYSDPESIRYRYKLKGLSPDWIISRDQRAVYSQLAPGDYTFLLSAADNDLFFPKPQVTYSFTIKPPFWKRPWFIIVFVSLLFPSIYGIMRTRERRLERQATMRREKLVHQFELLKSQINPHFLFNNFNTLVALIEENPPAAVAYVERLSDFYRSILQYREHPVIKLEEELDLLRNYSALLKERFADNLRINICDQLKSGYIIPLTLQLLVENAIKHNTVSRKNPLTINISEAVEGFVVVQNNLQKKRGKEASTGFGLESITKRYAILTDKKVRLEENQEGFSVSIPLLKMVDAI